MHTTITHSPPIIAMDQIPIVRQLCHVHQLEESSLLFHNPELPVNLPLVVQPSQKAWVPQSGALRHYKKGLNSGAIIKVLSPLSIKDQQKIQIVMYLLHCLRFFSALQHRCYSHPHSNEAADVLIRNRSRDFLRAHPQASQFQTLLLCSLLSLILPQQLH